MVAVPEVIPVTTPVVLTVAMPEAPEDHAPPVTVLLKAVVEPAHTTPPPLIVPATGNELTVMALVVFALPQLLVTV
jgi:hypothetical protein